jgi:hypothetical protein
MGYTHYWTQTRDFTREEWSQFREDMETLLNDVQHAQGIPLGNGAGEPGTSPEISGKKIWFNGVGDDSHETFCLNRVRPPKEPWQRFRGGDFCKTARKPYDLAVTAALCYIATVPDPAAFSVSSDGHGRDFVDGLAEARRALPRYANVLDIPRGILESDRWIGPWTSHHTDLYRFLFCVDGKAYVIRLKDGASYCFPTRREAAEFGVSHNEILNATGYFDDRRRRSLKRQQEALFRRLVENAGMFGGLQRPPAYVRPGEMPEPEVRGYYFEELLKALA